MITLRLLLSCLWDLALIRVMTATALIAVTAGGMGVLAGYALDQQLIHHTWHVLRSVLTP